KRSCYQPDECTIHPSALTRQPQPANALPFPGPPDGKGLPPSPGGLFRFPLLLLPGARRARPAAAPLLAVAALAALGARPGSALLVTLRLGHRLEGHLVLVAGHRQQGVDQLR